MKNKRLIWLFSLVLLFVWTILPPSNADALPQPRQTTITSPSQLIDAVNNLRASYGLAALTTHTALMQSAQSQVDYMAVWLIREPKQGRV